MIAGSGRRASRAILAAGLLIAASTMIDRSSMIVLAQDTSSPTAAPTATTTSTSDDCVSDYDASLGVDYFPDKAEIIYAETFAVTYELTYKVLTIIGDVYVLYQCGTPTPELTDVDVREYISVPVDRVATGTPDHIPRIELLGHRDSIVAYTEDTSRIGSPCVDALVANGTIVEATTFNATCGVDVADNELLVELEVDVSFGDMLETGWCSGAPPREKAVAVYSYFESGPESGLAEAEAIKLFSLFYNEEAKANEIFREIEFLWLCTKNNAQGCSLRLEQAPEVAWFSYIPTDTSSDAFYEAGSGWGSPSNESYYAYAINNTGGVMLECPDVEDFLMTDEEMLACFGNATVCVFGADYAEVEAVFDEEVLNNLTCVQNDRVYDITLSGINAWFEAKSVEPHVMMEDMIVVLHGEDFNYGIGSYERLLLRHVPEEESESGNYYPDVGTCDDPDAELEIQGQCLVIVDFDTCDESPATRVLPRFAVAAATVILTAIAAIALS